MFFIIFCTKYDGFALETKKQKIFFTSEIHEKTIYEIMAKVQCLEKTNSTDMFFL